MLDKEARIQKIAARYTPALAGAALDALRERFTSPPVPASMDPVMGRRLRTGPGTGYARLEHGQIIRTSERVRMSRKKRLALRRAKASA